MARAKQVGSPTMTGQPTQVAPVNRSQTLPPTPTVGSPKVTVARPAPIPAPPGGGLASRTVSLGSPQRSSSGLSIDTRFNPQGTVKKRRG